MLSSWAWEMQLQEDTFRSEQINPGKVTARRCPWITVARGVTMLKGLCQSCSLARRKGKRHCLALQSVAPFPPPAKLRRNPFCEVPSCQLQTAQEVCPARAFGISSCFTTPCAHIPSSPPCSLSRSAKVHGPLYCPHLLETHTDGFFLLGKPSFLPCILGNQSLAVCVCV